MLENSGMKKLIFSLGLLAMVSCGSYKTEMWFNADGSGKTELSFDLGAMIKEMKSAFDGIGKEMMKDSLLAENTMQTDSFQNLTIDTMVNEAPPALKEGGGNEVQDTQWMEGMPGQNQGIGSVFPAKKKSSPEVFMSSLDQGKVDTMVNFYSIIPDSIKNKLANPKLLKQVELEMHLDSANETGLIAFRYHYKDLKEAIEIGKLMETTEVLETGNADSYQQFQRNFSFLSSIDYNVKAGTLVSAEEDLFKSGMVSEKMLEGVDPENEFAFKLFLEIMGMDKTEITLHLPRKIKEVKGIEYMQVDDNTVKLIFDMAAIIKSKKVPGYEIRF